MSVHGWVYYLGSLNMEEIQENQIIWTSMIPPQCLGSCPYMMYVLDALKFYLNVGIVEWPRTLKTRRRMVNILALILNLWADVTHLDRSFNCLQIVAFSRVSYSWDYTVAISDWLLSISNRHLTSCHGILHVLSWLDGSFALFLNYIPLYGCTVSFVWIFLCIGIR